MNSIQAGDIITFEDLDFTGSLVVNEVIEDHFIGTIYHVTVEGDPEYPVYPSEVKDVLRLGVVEKPQLLLVEDH